MVDFDLEIEDQAYIQQAASAAPGFPAIIKIGCDMDGLTDRIHSDERVRPFFKQFYDVPEYYKKHTVDILIHEVLHLVLYNLCGYGVSHSFDWIDCEHEISGCSG